MDEYKVVWSRESIYDVADIADYIELRFGQERADRFTDDIDAEGAALGRNFRIYTGTGIYYRKRLILKKVFGPSILFYYVDDAAQTVYVIRALRHERNWQKILREGISYTFDCQFEGSVGVNIALFSPAG